MSHLYVCLFSNGCLKVGRSAKPASRIKRHSERVGCVGIDLLKSDVFECVGSVVYAESELIKRCSAEATACRGNEWFVGLDFGTVCEWAQCASESEVGIGTYPLPEGEQHGFHRYLLGLPRDEREPFGKRCGSTFGRLMQIAYGNEPATAELSTAIDRESGGVVGYRVVNAAWEAKKGATDTRKRIPMDWDYVEQKARAVTDKVA